ncbi:15752_t:CDS:1, partial [Funneliformis geosporum]
IKTRAIPIFEKTHPGMIAVFAFDNSSSHAKLANDTLNAMNMNLNPGGKQPIMRDTIFNGQVQTMVFPSDYFDETLHGKPKGMKIVLQERGLWSLGLKAFCGKNNIILENPSCCARHILAAQEDF